MFQSYNRLGSTSQRPKVPNFSTTLLYLSYLPGACANACCFLSLSGCVVSCCFGFSWPVCCVPRPSLARTARKAQSHHLTKPAQIHLIAVAGNRKCWLPVRKPWWWRRGSTWKVTGAKRNLYGKPWTTRAAWAAQSSTASAMASATPSISHGTWRRSRSHSSHVPFAGRTASLPSLWSWTALNCNHPSGTGRSSGSNSAGVFLLTWLNLGNSKAERLWQPVWDVGQNKYLKYIWETFFCRISYLI